VADDIIILLLTYKHSSMPKSDFLPIPPALLSTSE